MRIFDIKSAWVNGTAQIRAQVLPDSCREPLELWYHFEGLDGPLETDADPFVAAMLPSCMLDNEPCIVDGHVSKTFFDNLPWAKNVLDDWYPFLKPVTVEARRHHIPRFDADAAGVGCCFSGDVDSWYSFLENRPQVTHLLTVRGFDIGLDNDTLWRRPGPASGRSPGPRASG